MATGMRYTFTDTGVNDRAISDAVYMLDWTKAPLLNLLDMNAVGKFNLINFPSTKIEVIEDTMAPQTTLATEAIDNNETNITVTSTTGYYFRVGDIILIDSEQMRVASVAADDITVDTRPFGSTSATTHDNGSTITIVGRVMPEGSNATTGYSTVTTQPYNYSQIISQAAQATKTAIAIKKIGIDDEMDYQVAKLFADNGRAGLLAQMLAKTFYYGQRVQRTSSGGSASGSMGGFSTFVTTNVTALASASLQKSDIHTKLRQIAEANGECTDIVTNAWGMEKVTAMYEGYVTMAADETLGGSAITKVRTVHGVVNLVEDWMCPAGNMYFINRNKCGWLPVRKFAAGKIAEQGDYYLTDVVGEYSFMVVNEKSHGIITGFSTTS